MGKARKRNYPPKSRTSNLKTIKRIKENNRIINKLKLESKLEKINDKIEI